MADADGHADGDERERKRRQLISVSSPANDTVSSVLSFFVLVLL